MAIDTSRRIHTFSKGNKIFGETFHYANPVMYSFDELEKALRWCQKTFGSPGYRVDTMKTVWNYDVDSGYVFWFGEEKDLMLFILRWS